MDQFASQVLDPIRPVDQVVLDLLRREEGLSIQDFMDRLEVTATAIRQRVDRLEESGHIERRKLVAGRGRPSFCYYLTDKGWRQAGVTYRDLAISLWSVIQSTESSEVRLQLVHQVAEKLGALYQTLIPNQGLPNQGLPSDEPSREDSPALDLAVRMQLLADLLNERKVPTRLTQDEQALPILEVHACPYPDLVNGEQDRCACQLEQVALSTALGHPVELSKCRLDGHGCCEFTPVTIPVSVAASDVS